MGGQAELSSLPISKSKAISLYNHDGFRQHLVLAPAQVRRGFAQVQGVQQRAWADPQIRAQHVPSVLPPVRQGHRVQEARLDLQLRLLRCWGIAASTRQLETQRCSESCSHYYEPCSRL